MIRRFYPVILVIGLMLGPAVASGQFYSGSQVPLGELTKNSLKRIDGGLGFGMISEDLYFRLNIGTELDFGRIGFGLQIPLNIRIYDREPKGGSTIRKEDWDEFTDWAKIIRYFRYGRKRQTIYVRVGELHACYLGHGTIVDSYYNNTMVDHFRLGVQFDVNFKYGGVETVMDNIFSPNFIGARAYVRPVSFFKPKSYANNLAIGFTLVSDIFAPLALQKDPSGTLMVTSSNLPAVKETGGLTIFGVDIEFQVLKHKLIDIIPYTDFNHIIGAKGGWHLGVLTNFKFSTNFGLRLRLEYRYLNNHYIPGYIDSYYETSRYQFPFGSDLTKAQYVKNPHLRPQGQQNIKGSGIYAEGVFRLFNLLYLGLVFEDRSGPKNSNLAITLTVPALKIIKFGAYYYKRYFDGFSEIFSKDQAMFIAEAKVRLYSMLYLLAQYSRSWQMNTIVGSPDFGKYVTTNNFNVGVTIGYSF